MPLNIVNSNTEDSSGLLWTTKYFKAMGEVPKNTNRSLCDSTRIIHNTLCQSQSSVKEVREDYSKLSSFS